MTPFLKQIARQYIAAEEDLSRLVFVFPSRRAVVFFREYLCKAVAESSHAAIPEPVSLTMDEFFLKLSCLRKADEITLLSELYDCYKAECSAKGLVAEPLDDFVFWGNMILADFNDIDKYRVDARNLLRNIAEYRAIHDDFSYLSDTQREAMERFMKHFGNMGMVGDGKNYKQLFANIWDILLPLYDSFRGSLSAKGISYEGAIYREVARTMDNEGAACVLNAAFPGCSRVVFCGLNALNECEKTVMSSLKKLGLAHFCWDYVSPLIRNRENRSSMFMDRNLELFGNDLVLESCDELPAVEVISVPSAIGQTKLLPQILEENKDIVLNEKTAVMLADETLLLPLLSSVPRQAGTINVTMGYPMTSSSFFSLMDDMCNMVLRSRKKDGQLHFYHKLAWSVTLNNIFVALSDAETREKVEAMKRDKRYFVAREAVCGTPLLDVVFACPELSDGNDNAADIRNIVQYLRNALEYFGTNIAGDETLRDELALELDFAMEYDKVLNLLVSKNLDLSPAVWLRLLHSLLTTKSVPFAGEPLCGLQIMGPLETRALDFDHLIIMSANEGVFPRKRVASSFIPPLMRRAFELPTYEYQDAVWAYYFYRMIQRPKKVWLIYDSRSDGMNPGEESRYIKQLRYHFQLPIKFRNAFASPEKVEGVISVEKTPEIIDKLHERTLSASALKSYLTCPLQFYYSYVENLKTEDEVAETLDGSMMGNVLHNTLEDLFKGIGDKTVTVEVLEGMIRDTAFIRERIRHHIMDQLKTDELKGREIVLSRMSLRNVLAILRRDVEILKASGFGSFKVEVEKPVCSGMGNFRFGGRMDRMDLYPDGTLKIIDYKTGKVEDSELKLSDETAASIVDKIFAPDADVSKMPLIALQLFIYCYMMRHPDTGCRIPAFSRLVTSIYSTRRIPGECPGAIPESFEFNRLMEEALLKLLDEMENPEIPFTPSPDEDACKNCKFVNICQKCSR